MTTTLIATALKGYSSDHRPVVLDGFGSPVISFNAGNASDEKVLADLCKLLALDPLAVGLQEVADRRPILAKAAKACGYVLVQPNGPVQGHCALLVRGDANPRNIRLKQISPHTDLSKADARDIPGGRKGSIPTKYILAVDVTDNGTDRTVATWHGTPGASHNETASRLLGIQAGNSADWIEAQPLWTDLMGDCNGQAGRHEFAPLRKVATPYSAPSRKGAAIDIHWVREAAKHQPAPKPEPQPTPEAAMSGYHRADTKSQWFEDKFPGSVMTPNCVILHTTESMSWPSYSGGAVAPNYTARPNFEKKRLDWRQHFPDERSSRALQNDAGGVETNTLNVVQVELIGTCDPTHAKTWAGRRAGRDYIYWPEAPAWVLREVGRFLADQHKRHGTKLVAPKPFKAYPASFGENNGVRMNVHEWLNFYGVAGHQHVPENDHGDPGNIDIDRILGYAIGKPATKPDPAPTPTPAPKPAPQPAPADRPYHEQAAIDETRTVARNAAKHGHKHRASKWRSILNAMLGRSK